MAVNLELKEDTTLDGNENYTKGESWRKQRNRKWYIAQKNVGQNERIIENFKINPE